MLSQARKHESLSGKLMLSTALVAVTAGYGWWQHDTMSRQQAAAIAAMQMQGVQAQPQVQPQTMAAAPLSPAAAPQTAASDAVPTQKSSPGQSVANAPPAAGNTGVTAKSTEPKSTQLAMAAPSQNAAPATPAAPEAAQTEQPPAAPLTGMDSIRMFLPVEGVSPPLPPVTGIPDAGALPSIPAGSHLEDGDYRSDKVSFEWGDLRARIAVTGGKITTVQILTYPDHRSQSLYLIQLADPILTSEVIKSQQSNVDVVSSATNTSIAFRDAIASAIVKATR